MNGVRARHAVRGLGVAIDTGLRGIVRRIQMAIRAHRAVVWQLPVGVIERRAQPTRRGVAAGVGARGREARADVVGHAAAQRLCALICRNMAAVAVGRQIARIIIVDVAGVAGRDAGIGVRSRQREARGAMVKHPRGPRGNWMARSALRCRGREARGHVVGHVAANGRGAHKRRGVATVAIG